MYIVDKLSVQRLESKVEDQILCCFNEGLGNMCHKPDDIGKNLR